MQPNRLGRILGIGTRIAAEKIRDRAAQAGQAAPAPNRPAVEVGAPPMLVGRKALGVAAQILNPRPEAAIADGGRRLARGAGRFGGAMLQPVARAGGILTLQISGVFFALFALFFLSHTWQTWRAAGWHDRHTEVYAALTLLFGWFTVSSFWRAKRKERGL
jgi:hypothetical protein